jgi:small multidrug resistance pump
MAAATIVDPAILTGPIAMEVPGVRKWALLLAAIGTEVSGTLSLRASQDHSAWLAVVVAGYLASFYFLALVLRAGMPVGVAYGVWGAVGTAATAALGAVIFGDPFTTPIIAGIGLIIAGVLMVELGSRRPAGEETPP